MFGVCAVYGLAAHKSTYVTYTPAYAIHTPVYVIHTPA